MTIGSPLEPLTWLGLPPHAFGWGAGLFGVLLLVPSVARSARRLGRFPLGLPLLALSAALLSICYFALVLGGQPRIIDASTYLLEARTFAAGAFTFEAGETSALFRGRFLISPPADRARLGAIFPPGYPAILSVFVRLGDFRLLGPTLAIAITLATAWLGILVTRRRWVGLLAALFSVLSAAIRYHTADTMSHGWSMLLATLALCAAVSIHARSRPALTKASLPGFERLAPHALLGSCLGALAATRPLTALAIGLACLLPLFRCRDLAAWSCFALALAPGLCLLALHNRALTGELLGSPQLRYYALADGPPGCFRLGLGAGCQVEHADVVAAQGGQGLTLGWMLQNTVHRLHWHALDVANCELLLPIAWYWLGKSALAGKGRRALSQPLALAVLALPTAYALFYFQGSYPGGGARFLSELLPALHVALAAGLLSLRRVALGISLSLLGYAGHAAHVHTALPGAPPLETRPGKEGVPRVETDHAFNLLFVPGRMEAGQRPSVVRATNDARRLAPRAVVIPAKLEAEADWPVQAQAGLWTERVPIADPCVGGGRALRLHPGSGASRGDAWVELELTGVPPGVYELWAHVWDPGARCRGVPLGAVALPRRFQLFLADLPAASGTQPLHLDRLTLLPAP